MKIYPFLFSNLFAKLDAEMMHNIGLWSLKLIGNTPVSQRILKSLYIINDPRLAVSALGLKFPNPLGLASGFDKDASSVVGLSYLGFGFIEVGTVTPFPQKGNPKPRLFRLVEDRGIINRLGFPGSGSVKVCRRLEKIKSNFDIIVGVSLGKSKHTSLEKAEEDYLTGLQNLYNYADFFVINVSSPNTPGLRTLQKGNFLANLVKKIITHGRETASEIGANEKPVLVKISPDMNYMELDNVLDIVLSSGVSGIVATNTTVDREGLKSKNRREEGGLSGIPLRSRATELIEYIYNKTGGKLLIIGVGGIFSTADALEKLASGASLLQAYTGFIYTGPAFVKRINQGIIDFMDKERINDVTDIIGNRDVIKYIHSSPTP